MVNRHSRGFIEAVLNQILTQKDKTIAEIARENNISDTTVHYWLKTISDRPKKAVFSTSEQFKVVCEYKELEKEEQGRYLRENGLFSTDINTWEKNIMTSLNENEKKVPFEKKEKKELEAIIAKLQEELKNKNAVIAELTTISILKKKAEIMGIPWLLNEEDIEQLKTKKGL
jgi:transposase-like protein